MCRSNGQGEEGRGCHSGRAERMMVVAVMSKEEPGYRYEAVMMTGQLWEVEDESREGPRREAARLGFWCERRGAWPDDIQVSMSE